MFLTNYKRFLRTGDALEGPVAKDEPNLADRRLVLDLERERGVTLVLIFLCAYVLHRRKKHQRNTIRLRSHRIPLFQNELEGMTPSQPRSPRLQFPFLFECTKNIRTS